MGNRTSETVLHRYIEQEETFYAIYEAYQPDTTVLRRIVELQKTAHVLTPSRYTCPDCARNLPAMARIAEHLPGWTWEVFDSDTNEDRKAELGITRIPTFILYESKGGRESGRIVENPITGSLEQDLLRIVQSQQHGHSSSDTGW